MTCIPILAAGEPSIGLIIILIISVVSWLVNLFQGSKPKKPVNRPRPANQGPSELERFLQQVVGNPPGEKKPPAMQPPRPARAAPAAEKKSKKRPQAAGRPVAPPRPADSDRAGGLDRPADQDRPGSRLAQTHLATADLGQGVRSHVTSHLETRNVDRSVQRDVESAVQRNIDDTVHRDIGADQPAATIQRPAPHPLIQALRNPQGVRQAIVLSEILNRPKSMR